MDSIGEDVIDVDDEYAGDVCNEEDDDGYDG